MPFVRISLLKTLTADHKGKISRAVHIALMEEFDVPFFNLTANIMEVIQMKNHVSTQFGFY